MALRNAALLVPVVIIKLTRRREGRLERGGLEEEGLKCKVLDSEDRGFEGIFLSLTKEKFRLHRATCNCIVGLREALSSNTFADFFPKR
jgi:hypothetical protein